MINVAAFEGPTPRSMTRLAFEAIQLSAAAFRLLVPWPETQRALREFQNKLEAFELFEHVDSVLQISPAGEVHLSELVRKTERLEPYRAVWATEGLGHYLAETSWQKNEAPRSLLNDERSELPARSLCALHAGMGLAFGNRFLRTLSRRSSEVEIRRVLQQFVMACEANSRAGYVGAAYESLGLVTRNLYPQIVLKVDQQLGKIDERLVSYFWHGVGRGIYFAPTISLPDSHSSERAMKMIRDELPHALGRKNALAGLAWATTLVNIRQPEILETFLKRHGDQPLDNEAFSNGVSSAVMIWRDSTVEDTYLEAFCQHQPDPSNAVGAKRWEQLVQRPCREALEHVYPVLRQQRRLGEVFSVTGL